MPNPYAPPSASASLPVIDDSAVATSLRYRTGWLRAVGGSFVLRTIVVGMASFLVIVGVGRLFGRRAYAEFFFMAQLVDLPCLLFTAVAMFKLTGARAARPARLMGRNLRPLARWFTVAWVVVCAAHHIIRVVAHSNVLLELQEGMLVGVLALTSSYAAELAPDDWLRLLAYAAAGLTLATLPVRYALGMSWLFDMLVATPTVIVTLLVARAADVD